MCQNDLHRGSPSAGSNAHPRSPVRTLFTASRLLASSPALTAPTPSQRGSPRSQPLLSFRCHARACALAQTPTHTDTDTHAHTTPHAHSLEGPRAAPGRHEYSSLTSVGDCKAVGYLQIVDVGCQPELRSGKLNHPYPKCTVFLISAPRKQPPWKKNNQQQTQGEQCQFSGGGGG